MGWSTQQTAAPPRPSAWALARGQHGVVTRRQLLALGLTPRGIEHRVARGRLHVVGRGVYAVGRPDLTRNGRWMAAILAGGGDRDADGAVRLRPGRGIPVVVLSYGSAAALFAIGLEPQSHIDVTTVA